MLRVHTAPEVSLFVSVRIRGFEHFLQHFQLLFTRREGQIRLLLHTSYLGHHLMVM